MSETGQRLCIKCGNRAGELGSDAYLIFFCNRCNKDFGSNKMRNNFFMSWAIARKERTPDLSLLGGQCDENWPDGFPEP